MGGDQAGAGRGACLQRVVGAPPVCDPPARHLFSCRRLRVPAVKRPFKDFYEYQLAGLQPALNALPPSLPPSLIPILLSPCVHLPRASFVPRVSCSAAGPHQRDRPHAENQVVGLRDRRLHVVARRLRSLRHPTAGSAAGVHRSAPYAAPRLGPHRAAPLFPTSVCSSTAPTLLPPSPLCLLLLSQVRGGIASSRGCAGRLRRTACRPDSTEFDTDYDSPLCTEVRRMPHARAARRCFSTTTHARAVRTPVPPRARRTPLLLHHPARAAHVRSPHACHPQHAHQPPPGVELPRRRACCCPAPAFRACHSDIIVYLVFAEAPFNFTPCT